VTILRRTLEALATAAAPAGRVLAADGALAPLLAAPIAHLSTAENIQNAETALGDALARYDGEPAAASPAGAAREHRALHLDRAATRADRLAGPPAARPARPAIRPVDSPSQNLPAIEAEPGLARFAARIQGGARAAATPVATVATVAKPVASSAAEPARSDRVQPVNAGLDRREHSPIEAALAAVVQPRRSALPPSRPEPISPPARSSLIPPLPALSSSAPSSSASSAASSARRSPSTNGARLESGRAPDPSQPAAAPAGNGSAHGIHLAAAMPPASGHGLAQLASWWREHESSADRPAPAPSAPPVREPVRSAPIDPLAGELDAMDAFGAALERVLVGEARRHGIPLDEP
jgi:hypothetical protein